MIEVCRLAEAAACDSCGAPIPVGAFVATLPGSVVCGLCVQRANSALVAKRGRHVAKVPNDEARA